jgi:hypothetical protein
MTDDEFEGYLAGGRDAMADLIWEIEHDHQVRDTPTHTALFTRTYPTYTETMWVHAYANAKLVVISYPASQMSRRVAPGVIRTIPVGWRDMASAETFRARFERTIESLASGGWVRKSHDASTAS